uniref:DNA-(apurinic or apyrimidinic site) endonuclease 2 n=1 Tax=Pinguiococcus pyrenoidosus TaxID=172671 RepID=A0A6U0TGC8_9STRA|mmetsp:Transcript_11065/g.41323  ORF Transcript_11065/g.41323 Transcript_11065/m.41323 type:complete len:666 (+) Transcript_11065:458-2455(+)
MTDSDGARRLRKWRSVGCFTVVTWNVGMKGLTRLVQDTPGGLNALLDSLEADVICLQETKLASRQALLKAPDLYFSSEWDGIFGFCTQAIGQQAVRGYRSTSYAGTATYVRKSAKGFVLAAADRMGEPLRDHSGSAIRQSSPSSTPLNSQDDDLNSETIPADLLRFTGEDSKEWNVDSEGRVIVTLHSVAPMGSSVVIVNVYAPASNREDERGGFKKAFHDSLTYRIMQLYSSGFKNIILCGDLNTIPGPLDIHTGNGMRREHVDMGYWDHEKPAESVRWLRGLLRSFASTKRPPITASGHGITYAQNSRDGNLFTDAFRVKHPDRDGAYTCWSTVKRHRETNCGARLDFFLLSPGFLCQGNDGSGPHDEEEDSTPTKTPSPDSAFALVDCDIWPEVEGSDHCPVWMAFRSTDAAVQEEGKEAMRSGSAPLQPDAMPQLFVSQWPEFRGRQQKIGDLFRQSAKSAAAAPTTTSTSPKASRPIPAGTGKRGAKKQKVTLHSFFQSATAQKVGKPRENGGQATADEQTRSLSPSSGGSDRNLEADMQEALRRSLHSARKENALPPSQPKAEGVGPTKNHGSAASVNDLFRKARSLAAAKQPNCFHGDPARVYNVKDRKSEHYGKRFWSCDHELHPNGDWKANPVPSNSARCPFFRWDTAYKGYKTSR